MSSILDALRKLEQEKATREKTSSASSVRELALEPEPDLDGDRRRRTAPVRTLFLLLGGALVTVGIGAGVVAAAVMVSRRDAPVQRVTAAAPSQPTTQTTTVQPVHVAALDTAEPESTEPEPLQVASATPPKPAAPKKSVAPPKAVPPPEPVAAAPKSAVANPQPATDSDAIPAQPATETDIEKLPILSESERVRLGLPPLKINIVGIPSTRNPRASALINMQKVYVGENIPGTSARLMDVNLRGVSLNVNGRRYFLSRR